LVCCPQTNCATWASWHITSVISKLRDSSSCFLNIHIIYYF
jgi:hypothetical protein